MSADVNPIRRVDVPTRLVHGPGAITRLGQVVAEHGLQRPLVVTDAGVVAAGLAARALEQLDDPVVFADVHANPDIALIDRGAAAYRDQECDGLVAIGGGSPMDAAKSMGVVVRHGGSIADYEWGRDPIEKRIRRSSLYRQPRAPAVRSPCGRSSPTLAATSNSTSAARR